MANNSEKKSPEFTRIKLKVLNNTIQASDSDASLETNSLSADSGTEQNQTFQNETRKKRNRKGSEWEIMEGLKDGQRFENKPNLFNGYLHKKRKWPLKGWHKVIISLRYYYYTVFNVFGYFAIQYFYQRYNFMLN